MIDFASRRRMMVDTQVRPSDVTEFPIIDAMLTVPREAFVPRDRVEVAYAGENLPLGDGRVILDPRTFAKMLETLDLGRKDLVLDIGMGLGYSSAVIARIAEAVVGLEDDEERADEAQSLLAENDADNVVVQKGTLHEGAPQNGPYDAMIIEGGISLVGLKCRKAEHRSPFVGEYLCDSLNALRVVHHGNVIQPFVCKHWCLSDASTRENACECAKEAASWALHGSWKPFARRFWMTARM